ncbi:hypothetical protein [Bacillus swezeyi]|nr:hypothetical protein [Bacillus swezeyi]
MKKKKRQKSDKSDYLCLFDLLEPLYYLLRLAVGGIAKFIN